MQCFRVAGIGDDLGAILQWEYIAMSYKSVLAKSANAELLVPLALAADTTATVINNAQLTVRGRV